MLINHIAAHVLARRRSYRFHSWLLCIARTARVLLYPHAHRQLCSLPLFAGYVAQPGNDDLFHHLSHSHYLARHLNLDQRVRAVLTHYRTEDALFDTAYREAVYRGAGLTLWEERANGSAARLRLAMATRNNAEGDLTLALDIDSQRLHRISFSWVDGSLGGSAERMLPYIARNQGHGPEEEVAFARFNQAFPNNSPSYFCLAAMHGIAEALGVAELLAVASAWQVAARPEKGKHFANAYDGLWAAAGGMPSADGTAWRLPVPAPARPLHELPAKHRKRTAMRRAHWAAISAACRDTLRAHRRGKW